LILLGGGLFLIVKSTHEIHEKPECERGAHGNVPKRASFAAVMIAVLFMMFFASALSFLLLIGVMLVAEGFHQHILKGYIYFAMTFSMLVEILNLRIRGHKTAPIELRKPQF
jgi:predicted tellurium resistance membrane protein TerC